MAVSIFDTNELQDQITQANGKLVIFYYGNELGSFEEIATYLSMFPMEPISFLKGKPEDLNITGIEEPAIVVYKDGTEVCRAADFDRTLTNSKIIRLIASHSSKPALEDQESAEKESENSLCKMKFEYISKQLKIDIEELLCDKAARIEEIITLEELDENEKSELFEKVYKHLKDKLDECKKFPHIFVKEGCKRDYVLELLRAIRKFVIKKHGAVGRDIGFETNESFNTNLLGRPNQIIEADISIFQVDQTDQLKSAATCTAKKRKIEERQHQHFLGLVECKSRGVDTAVPQCLAYAAAAYQSNQRKQRVYGLNSDGTSCSLLFYDKVDGEPVSELSPTLSFMFPKMFEDEHKQLWMDDYTKVIIVIYSILCQSLRQAGRL